MKPLGSLPLFGWTDEQLTPNRPTESTRYPFVPGTRVAAGPSKDASTAISGAAKGLRARALSAIIRSSGGLTADEVAEQLGKSPFAIRPRIAELRCLGVVEPSQERRRNVSGMSATVWRVAGALPDPVSAERRE